MAAGLLVPFVSALRARGVPVGLQDLLAVARALAEGLHDSSVDGFYHVARALLVHDERHLDPFDEVFLLFFRGAADEGRRLRDELLEWLREAVAHRGELSPEAAELARRMSLEELLRRLEERLAEQRERHDGGDRWIGTGGSSPFGHSGAPRPGIRIGGPGGGRSAVKVADARLYRPYRGDVTLDVRQMQLALRRLRAFAREGTERELDLEATIDATARNAGELEVVTRPPRRPAVRVLLLMDVGGSMDPYAALVSRLFSAARACTHFRELRTYYFHNCVYDRVYRTEGLRDPVRVDDLLHEVGRHYRLILVGDALMAPYELLHPAGALGLDEPQGRRSGLQWLARLAAHFERSAWLNPEPPTSWHGNTIELVRRLFPMFPLTLDGLGQAVEQLVRGGRQSPATTSGAGAP